MPSRRVKYLERALAALVPVALVTQPMLPGQVVPRPQKLRSEGAALAIAQVEAPPAFAPQLAAFTSAVQKLGARPWRTAAPEAASLTLERGRGDLGDEGYHITHHAHGLVLHADHAAGAARGLATLLQLAELRDGQVWLPAVAIEDRADLPFRCFMVDMGRNPHSPATLRRVLDACWYYKVPLLMLHLSDDQLFSWPSTAFPRLLDTRSGWTRADFVALEAYAEARGVALIPEIDTPGHSTILRTRYPEVFGTTPTELATRPEATKGMCTLIDELLEVFTATPYVHLGGDEAYGVPGNDQLDYLNRLARHVAARGRRAIVWEGPRPGQGEHKLDTAVLQMNWRTVDFPAQQMLDHGYEVINASWDPLYIVDHYPRTMFTAVSVARCYRFEPRRFAHVNPAMPTFASPHLTDSADGILGFCMPWWEGREQNLLPLCVPRLAAVASAAWNRAGERDFADFQARQERQLRRLSHLLDIDFFARPMADPATQTDNLAFQKPVEVSAGASQPVFGPWRLTNGIPDRFDHFLGFPTGPEPLTITVDLGEAVEVQRVVVHETAVGQSHEIYELLVSANGRAFARVGTATKGTRGQQSFVEHRFTRRPVRYVQVRTKGCHGLTFPSFSRLTEIQVFRK